MVYEAELSNYLSKSLLLIEAYPDTTRITTKYRKEHTSHGHITVKTFEPSIGVCLKYRTNQTSDVTRLLVAIGKIGLRMVKPGHAAQDDSVNMDEDDVKAEPTPTDYRKSEMTSSQVPVSLVETNTEEAKEAAILAAPPKKKKKKGKK